MNLAPKLYDLLHTHDIVRDGIVMDKIELLREVRLVALSLSTRPSSLDPTRTYDERYVSELINSFAWSSTPQGHEFWHELYVVYDKCELKCSDVRYHI